MKHDNIDIYLYINIQIYKKLVKREKPHDKHSETETIKANRESIFSKYYLWYVKYIIILKNQDCYEKMSSFETKQRYICDLFGNC